MTSSPKQSTAAEKLIKIMLEVSNDADDEGEGPDAGSADDSSEQDFGVDVRRNRDNNTIHSRADFKAQQP